MNQPAYINRTHHKMEAALHQYESLLFRTIQRLDNVSALETREHFRLPPPAEAMHPISPETAWGEEYGNLWLLTDVTVPDGLEGETLCVIPDAEAVEILLFLDQKPAGIINSKNRFLGGEHSALYLTTDAQAGQKLSLAFECYAGHTCLGTQPYEQYDRDENIPDSCRRTYHGIRLCVMDRLIEQFLFDLSTVLQISRLPGENYTAMRAHECLMKAFPYLIQDVRQATPQEIHDSCRAVIDCLSPALQKGPGDRSRGYIGVTGHSHMDTAWLWPVEETIRKCARTYSEVLRLMEIYPDYTFIQSSALHLDWMRQYYPDIFEGIRKRVAEGRYEPNGGVWVECDCNITGGESMVRQFLYGQRFTQKYLGYRSDSFWLPDTFGYSAAIPQIMKGVGVSYFYTTKMSWADLNHFPADTFLWRGIDGSDVITHLNRTHFIPDVLTLNDVIHSNSDKYSCDMRLGAYGYGDGGGGPTPAMLEFLNRAKGLDGMPVIEDTTISAFMHKLEERRESLPVYDSELYLELHRGTLTQMHEVKRNNRKAEIALHDMELFNVLAARPIHPQRDAYYHTLLKNQFHDILPGTCIPRVYEIAIPEMHRLIEDAKEATLGFAAEMQEEGERDSGYLTLCNTLSHSRHDLATLPGTLYPEGTVAQHYTDSDGQEKTVFPISIPAMSSLLLPLLPAEEGQMRPTDPAPFSLSREATGEEVLTTPYYSVTFDRDGYLSALTDLATGRQLRNPKGAALGTFWFGEDVPNAWDNWDIDDDIFQKLKPITSPVERTVVSVGAVEYRIRTRYRIGRHSEALVDTVFYAANPRIDYEVRLDWQEQHALLKVGFDVNIRSGFVRNEIQFGHVCRPTTRNNSYEAAKFEVCNHKWSDLSETGYGVAILNDGKYGISAEGSDLRLTLQKSGCRPDPFSDRGIHHMSYSLLPHRKPFCAEAVIEPAYEFNYAPLAVPGRLTLPSLFELSAPGIICETVKNAEDIPGAYVLRLYEAECNHTLCHLSLTGAKKVWLTNMLEERQELLPLQDGRLSLSFSPFEIKTLLVER